jgi:hypothetical protein
MSARFLRLVTVLMVVLLTIPSSSLSHPLARLGDPPTEGTLATLAGTDWNLASDFRVSPNQENPNRDSCGNLGVWHFMSADLNRQTYTLLQGFKPDLSNILELRRPRTPDDESFGLKGDAR